MSTLVATANRRPFRFKFRSAEQPLEPPTRVATPVASSVGTFDLHPGVALVFPAPDDLSGLPWASDDELRALALLDEAGDSEKEPRG